MLDMPTDTAEYIKHGLKLPNTYASFILPYSSTIAYLAKCTATHAAMILFYLCPEVEICNTHTTVI